MTEADIRRRLFINFYDQCCTHTRTYKVLFPRAPEAGIPTEIEELVKIDREQAMYVHHEAHEVERAVKRVIEKVLSLTQPVEVEP